MKGQDFEEKGERQLHFFCQCGFRFNDTSDSIAYKARILADQDVKELVEILEYGEQPHSDDLELFAPACDLIGRSMFQCPQCGRLYVEDSDYSYIQFVPCEEAEPAPEVNKKLLISAHGKLWHGCLYGDWKNPKPDYLDHKGYIEPQVNLDYDNLEFDDYNAFETRYYEIFEELKGKGILEYAVMRVNGIKKHTWSCE